jgi:tetratricopeptide (TPR) repeat protein
MSYLILDTNKSSSQSLRLQLSGISDQVIFEVSDLAGLAALQKRNRVPPELVFLDLDGDREKVKAFEEYLLLSRSATSSLVTFASSFLKDPVLKSDCHVRKPVFIRDLRAAIVKAQSATQEQRSAIIFLGERLPVELIREVGRSRILWKQLIEVKTLKDFMANRKELAQVGALLIQPDHVNAGDIEMIAKVQSVTSAARISLVCLSNDPVEIRALRLRSDFFVSSDTDWKVFLERLATTRLMRMDSKLGLDRAKYAMKAKRYEQAIRILDAVIEKAPFKTEALLLSAECSFLKKDLVEAKAKYRAVLKLNPCLPKPYVRLFHMTEGEERREVLKSGVLYCPDVRDFQELSGSARD